MTEEQLKKISDKIDLSSESLSLKIDVLNSRINDLETELKIEKKKDIVAEKKDSRLQDFTFIWGLLVGLISGVFGNWWATVAFEYSNGNSDLQCNFYLSTFLLVLMIIIFVILGIHFWRKIPKSKTTT